MRTSCMSDDNDDDGDDEDDDDDSYKTSSLSTPVVFKINVETFRYKKTAKHLLTNVWTALRECRFY